MTTYRTLREEKFLQSKKTKKAIVLVTAYIENGFWFQVKVGKNSFQEFLSELGFDVYILSFIPKVEKFQNSPFIKDVSFEDIVLRHLPNFHTQIAEKYEDIHYITHSYGSTLTTCFLLGYTNKNDTYQIHAEKAKLAQKNVKSFISIAGVYKVILPDWIKIIMQKLLSTLLKLKIHYMPLKQLNALENLPYLEEILSITKLLPPEYNPLLNPRNVNMKSFLQAVLGGGSSNETVEATITLSGLFENWHPKNSTLKSHALENFSENLNEFHLPTLIMVGNKDTATTPHANKEFGYDLIRSEQKKFVILENYGHQDIMVAKNPTILRGHVEDWLCR